MNADHQYHHRPSRTTALRHERGQSSPPTTTNLLQRPPSRVGNTGTKQKWAQETSLGPRYVLLRPTPPPPPPPHRDNWPPPPQRDEERNENGVGERGPNFVPRARDASETKGTFFIFSLSFYY